MLSVFRLTPVKTSTMSCVYSIIESRSALLWDGTSYLAVVASLHVMNSRSFWSLVPSRRTKQPRTPIATYREHCFNYAVRCPTSLSNVSLASFHLWYSNSVCSEPLYGHNGLSTFCVLAKYSLKYLCPVKNLASQQFFSPTSRVIHSAMLRISQGVHPALVSPYQRSCDCRILRGPASSFAFCFPFVDPFPISGQYVYKQHPDLAAIQQYGLCEVYQQSVFPTLIIKSQRCEVTFAALQHAIKISSQKDSQYAIASIRPCSLIKEVILVIIWSSVLQASTTYHATITGLYRLRNLSTPSRRS